MSEQTYHNPVLLHETISDLITANDGIYIDGTLGGGGHSAAILSELSPEGRLFSIDQDSDAIAESRARIGNDPRFTIVQGNFGYMEVLLPPAIRGKVDGILLDLGVSSHQIDDPDRGFSYQQEGPLDMRMSATTGLTAESVINDYDPHDLAGIFFRYGEERLSRKIAKAIAEARPLHTTGELRKVIEGVVKGPHKAKSLARIYQAVRIEVNRELEVFEQALEQGLRLLKTGGRLAVISYHSLEDRIAKTFIKSGRLDGKIEKDFYGHDICAMEPLYRKYRVPSAEEIAANSRARSAKLRVGIKKEPR